MVAQRSGESQLIVMRSCLRSDDGLRHWRVLGSLALLSVLAGCLSTASLDLGDPRVTQSLASAPASWQLRGRVVLHGEDGRRLGSSLLWHQQGERYTVTLAHTLGAVLRLEWDGDQACLRRGAATPQCVSDPQRLAQLLTGGTALPMAQLRYWLLGRAAPGDELLRTRGGQPLELARGPWQLYFGPRLRRGGARSLPRELKLWHTKRLVLQFRPRLWVAAGRVAP